MFGEAAVKEGMQCTRGHHLSVWHTGSRELPVELFRFLRGGGRVRAGDQEEQGAPLRISANLRPSSL
jgi:hypothetical protein